MDTAVRPGCEAELSAATGETIFALASGRPPAAIAIIRISGPRAWDAAASIGGKLPPARRVSRRRFRHPATNETIDTGLMLLFEPGSSPTGEAVAELHVHGGWAVVDAILSVLSDMEGCRAATAGEFTWRAFQAGRMDLTEVEGLGDLLAAETEAQRRAAVQMTDGHLARCVRSWRQDLLDCAARIEAVLDFSDEDDVSTHEIGVVDKMTDLVAVMRRMIDAPSSERLHDGIGIVIAGPPNAGKSTLLNALVGREAAITAATAGTTRDLIEVPAMIAGLSIKLTDSAGLRDVAVDDVERVGISRARSAIVAADIVLWLGDEPPPVPAIWVHARADEPDRASGDLRKAVMVSALTGAGLPALADIIRLHAATLMPREGELALNRRQQTCVRHSAAMIENAIGSTDPLLTADALRRALHALDQLSGVAYVDQMLDSLFSRFCIGK